MTEDPVIAIDCHMQVLPKSYYKTVMLQVVLTNKNQTRKQTNYFCCMFLIATIAMLLG